MNIPKIITADHKDLDRIKGVLKLGFASDALLRLLTRMISSIQRKILLEHLFGTHLAQNLMKLF